MQKELQQILSKSSSWHQIYDQLVTRNAGPNSSTGNLFEYFCKYYYLAEPTVASDYKNVWLYEETPREVKEQLNLSKSDHGVDLILEDREGAYTVVQCKFRNDQSSRLSWTKDKIANLFAEADQADFITVFTNASDLDDYSKSKHAKKFRLVTFGELIELQPVTIRQMVNLTKHKPAETKIIRKPRKHQIVAIEKVLKGFQGHSRGQLILPCGAGKTLTALWIKEQLNSKHTLVIVPSLALLRQIKNEWHSTQAKWLPYLCVCSEQDIDNDIDVPVAHTYEIGGRVTTDDREIRTFLKKHPATVIYSTYQSLDVISTAVRRMDFQFDLAICDEAHKTAGSRRSIFGLVHNNNKVPVKKRLYMTATPRIVSKKVKDKLGEDNIKYLADMNVPNTFGPEFHRMSFAEAINKKILVDYQIIAIGVSDAEIQQQISERQFAGDDETTIEDIANNYALGKVMAKYGATHAITFHSSIKRAKQFKERHRKLYNDVLTDHVSGLQSTNDRNVLMNRFEKGLKAVMTNARCLTEGVDVPAIDAVYFCDPKNSKIDIVQASGRALRRAKHKNKKFGYIVVPIFHRNREKVEDTIESGAFKNLIAVVRALCDQDKRLVDEINRIKIGKGVRKPAPRSTHIKIEDELPLIVLENFEEKLKGAIFDQVIEKTADNWTVMHELLKEFRKKNNRWPNLKAKSEIERILGRWCSHRRSEYKDNILSKERIEALEKLGFSWNRFDEKWEENFIQLSQFLKLHQGRYPTHSKVTKNSAERKLSTWCVVQRRAYAQGDLSEEKIKKLLSIEFSFNPEQEYFESTIDELNQFRRQNPHRWPNSMATNPVEKKLGRWCTRIRKAYRKGKLDQDKIRRLNLLDFPWNLEQEKWNKLFPLLKTFRKKKPARWPSYLSKDPLEKTLAGFCRYCRANKKTLTKTQVKELTRLGFQWDLSSSKEKRWMENYQKLVVFKRNYQRWPSHGSSDSLERQLGQWCQNQRAMYRDGKLTFKKVSKLKIINFPWRVLESKWDNMLLGFENFLKRNNGNLPSDHSKSSFERKLGKWLFRQRLARKKGLLNKIQLKSLKALYPQWHLKRKPGPKAQARSAI